MKSKLIKILIFSLSIVLLSIFTGYYYFKVMPMNQAEKVATKFELAVRTDNKSLIQDTLSPNHDTWERISKPEMYHSLQDHFGRFYQGVEVYQCSYYPSWFSSNETEKIYAWAKMKAKNDNKYRKYFIIRVEKVNNEWKLVQFFFPDFIDY